MAITRTPIVDDDGSGTTGTVINNSWKQELYDQIDATVPLPAGATWINNPYNAADYTANGSMIWTVEAADVLFDTYCLIGKTLLWAFDINATTVSGTLNTWLGKRVPAGMVPVSNIVFPAWGANPAGLAAFCNLVASTRILNIYPTATMTTNWAAGTNNVRVAANVMFQIV